MIQVFLHCIIRNVLFAEISSHWTTKNPLKSSRSSLKILTKKSPIIILNERIKYYYCSVVVMTSSGKKSEKKSNKPKRAEESSPKTLSLSLSLSLSFVRRVLSFSRVFFFSPFYSCFLSSKTVDEFIGSRIDAATPKCRRRDFTRGD